MPRYVSQRKGSYDCGPIALLNVLKWSGRPFSFKHDIYRLKKYCKYIRGKGVFSHDFSEALRRYKSLSFCERANITMKQIDDHLDVNGIVVLLISWKEEGKRVGHYFIITSKIYKFYESHNFGDDSGYKANTYLPRFKVVKYLRKSLRSHNEPKGWLIRKV